MSENRATKRLEYCDMGKRSLFKRSRTQEEAEEDTESPATKRRDVQPQPQPGLSSELLQSGLGSSYSSGEDSVNNMFDVFISHRGPDTKCSLAYPIYFLLHERGVEAFLDREELQSGERFPEAIEKAIACSKVDVSILSSGFAESEWCLKELLTMLNKYDMGKSTLIPIFYDVKPAEVKDVRGAFGQGFENLQSKNRNSSSEDIEQWRRALGKIGEISGYEGKGDLCRIICNKICELLEVGFVATSQKVLGIEKQLLDSLSDIMRCHENGRGVTSVEISGIGGIGKTTFAKELYNKIHHEFERSCFIEDVNGLIEKHGINEVHKHLLKKLFGQNSSFFKMEGRKHLMKKLHKAEILVVFDNIHRKIPLSKVFIEDNVSLSERSIIIVTSREEGVLKHDPEVKEYCKNLISLKIQTLDFDTSKQIFCHYAFGRINHMHNEFNELIEKMVKKCDGLPLALTLLGKHVYNKEINFWENLLYFMEDSLHNEVKDKLKFSYDNLGTELEKCLFLDVATFFRGEKENFLVQLRQRNEEDGKSVQYALDMLKSNLLIKVSSNGVLSMHDVLVDLGRSIVKDENSCPGHRSRVWYPSDVRLMLSDELGTEKVKALSLVSRGSAILQEDQCPWSIDVFNKLSSLEILILHGHCIEGDFSKLSKRLLWLRWTDFSYQEIPLKLYIKHLRVLQVTSENLIRLWEHPPQEVPSKLRELTIHCIKLERLPESIGSLRHLSSINLDQCESLKFIPESFGQLQGVKNFQLQGCHALEGLPESFGNLRSLSYLRMMGCRALKQLPETFGELRSLTSLWMGECNAMVSLPKSFGKLLQLKHLDITCCNGLERLPELMGRLMHLSSINLDKCKSLKFIPESFGQLQGLKTFRLQGCHALESLPESFGNLRSLSNLSMDGCRALKQLPETFRELRSLIFLWMEQCDTMVSLPETFGELRSLTFLWMEQCDAMVSLPESFGKLLRLKYLYITRCNGLERLSQSFQCLTSLSDLVVRGCRKIRFSPEEFQGLQPRGKGKWFLSTYLVDGMEVSDSWFAQINNTEQPHFDFWKNYSICHSQVPQRHNLGWLLREVAQDIQTKKKRYLYSSNNNNRTGASSARDLELIGFHFIESAGDMTFPYKVTFLSLRGFWNFRELPQFVGNNRYLKTLNICHCHSLQKLPDSLPCLQTLYLKWCCSLQELPDTIDNLPNLRHLVVFGCLALKGFPSSLRNLSCLTELSVEHCWMVEVINTQGLVSLTWFIVRNCVKLKSIVGLSDLGKLEMLKIEGCMNLKSIVGLSNICELDTLVIEGCFSLSHMPLPVGGFASFNSLSSLIINGCYPLRFSEDVVGHLLPNLRWRLLGDNHNLVHKHNAERLNAKTSPLFFATVKERLRHVLLSSSGSPDKPFSFSIHELELAGHTHIPSLPFIPHAAVTCFVSSVYNDDFSDHIPLPITDFYLFYDNETTRAVRENLRRFDFGEEIHVAVSAFTKRFVLDEDIIKRGDLYVNVNKDRLHTDGWSYPSYEASVKEGCIIFINGGKREQSELLASEIFKIFCSELIKQRLMSQAWTQLPSQLRIYDFSALDIAGCQITKISRHYNTCIMDEETGLTWKRRRCIFMDDHSLLLQQPKNSKHSFLAYPGVDCDLEAAVANFYEMSISILEKGKVVHSRKLQQISSKTQEEIPSPLNTLLQGRGFHSTSETMHRLSLFMLKELKNKGTTIHICD